MQQQRSPRLWQGGLTVALVASVVACETKITPNIVAPVVDAGFQIIRLIGDIPALGAPSIDSLLVDPHGLAFAETGNLWVANRGTGVATVYSALGVRQSLVVPIPTPTDSGGGAPTAVLSNATADFIMPNSSPAQLLFASADGLISGWNMQSTSAVVLADRSGAGASYTGLTTMWADGANFLFAADFRNGNVDVFDDDFRYLRSFTDPAIPAGFAPFGIAGIAGRLFVSFARQSPVDGVDEPGPTNGFIDVFNPDGSVATRFAARGRLNSPWGMVLAPTNFGKFADMLIVGNHGDGHVLAYNFNTGAFVGVISDFADTPIVIDGLWGLAFNREVGSNALYFASAPAGHGLVGTLTPR